MTQDKIIEMYWNKCNECGKKTETTRQVKEAQKEKINDLKVFNIENFNNKKTSFEDFEIIKTFLESYSEL